MLALTLSFEEYQCSILIKLNLPQFFFTYSASGVLFQRSLPHPRSQRFSSTKVFCVWFRHKIHFWLLHIHSKRTENKVIFPYIMPNHSSSVSSDAYPLSTDMPLHCYHQSDVCVWRPIYGLSTLSPDVPVWTTVPRSQAVLILFFMKAVLAILGPLHLHIN